MKMSNASNPCHRVAKLCRLGFMAVAMMVASQASAESVLCDATQANEGELPQLESSCPIGKGLWGSKQPRGSQEDSLFWIQCGLLSKPLPLAKAKPIYQKISTNVWMKPEAKGYRCLIGPYDTFADAKSELAQVRTLEEYQKSFVRFVDKSAKRSSNSKPAMVTAPVATTKPVKEMKATAAESVTTYPKEQVESEVQVQQRLTASVAGREYMVPYLRDDEHQFYMEHNKPWNRLDYESTKIVCTDQGMRLATEEEWQRLLGSKIMEQGGWPMHLPYWGSQKKGLFANGNVTQLRGTSLLNVLCVK
ncbi:SPOR domain-containing protein [Vibrio makurazakiensis]